MHGDGAEERNRGLTNLEQGEFITQISIYNSIMYKTAWRP